MTVPLTDSDPQPRVDEIGQPADGTARATQGDDRCNVVEVGPPEG